MAEVNSLVISVFIEQKIKKIVQEYVKLHPHNTWNNSINKCKAFSDFLANSQKGWTQRKFITSHSSPVDEFWNVRFHASAIWNFHIFRAGPPTLGYTRLPQR